MSVQAATHTTDFGKAVVMHAEEAADLAEWIRVQLDYDDTEGQELLTVLNWIAEEEPTELLADATAVLIPWMRARLAEQARQDENGDLCQTFSAILRRASEAHGTEPFTRDQCICLG